MRSGSGVEAHAVSEPLSRRALAGRFASVGASAAGLLVLGACGLLGPRLKKFARVGFLSLDRVPPTRFDALRLGLREHGWIEGHNLVIEERYADGKSERLAALAAELVGLNVDVITGPGSPPIQAAARATSTTAIVMLTTGDPVRDGLVASMARPGANVTGLTILAPALSSKRLEYLKDVAPALSWVALLTNSSNPVQQANVDEVRGAADDLDLEFHVLDVREANQLEPALTTLNGKSNGGLTVLADVLLVAHRARIVTWAAHNHTPAVYPAREYVDSSGLMSYGPSIVSIYRRAADYIDRILKGAQPADMPVEQPATFETVVNLKAAEALGITFPPHVAAQVTEWVQ